MECPLISDPVLRDFVEVMLQPLQRRADLGQLQGHYLLQCSRNDYLYDLVQKVAVIVWTKDLRVPAIDAQKLLICYLKTHGTPLMATTKAKV